MILLSKMPTYEYMKAYFARNPEKYERHKRYIRNYHRAKNPTRFTTRLCTIIEVQRKWTSPKGVYCAVVNLECGHSVLVLYYHPRLKKTHCHKCKRRYND